MNPERSAGISNMEEDFPKAEDGCYMGSLNGSAIPRSRPLSALSLPEVKPLTNVDQQKYAVYDVIKITDSSKSSGLKEEVSRLCQPCFHACSAGKARGVQLINKGEEGRAK